MNPAKKSDSDLRGHVYVFPASCAQRSLWFLDQLAPGTSLYNMHIGRRLASNINVGALQGSINELVRRHESLRTSFQAVDGEPAQVILTSLSVEVPATD